LGGHEISAAEEFTAALRDLYERSGEPPYKVLVHQGGAQKPQVKLNDSSLSEWLSGKSVPSDFAAVRFLVTYLGAKATARDPGYHPAPLSWWEQTHSNAKQERHPRRGGRPSRRPDRWPPATAAPTSPRIRRVSEVEFTELGVHPALGLPNAGSAEEGESHSWYPPYVPRDYDGLIDQALARGGLVVVEGRSGSGKSRAAAEAVRRIAADRQLLMPANQDELAALSEPPGRLREAVVWLDNLERFGGPGGFGLSMITRLCPHGRQDVVVVATLRSEERRRLERPPGLDAVNSSTADALRVATVIRLELQFSPAERERAAMLRNDPRIADWLDRGDSTGLAEYLAAGPPAVDRWLAGRNGEHLLGAALVSAAIDCRRMNYRTPLPLDLLAELARFYLAPADAYRPGRPSIEEALVWATEPVSGASSCLLPRAEGRYWAFDYLVDHMQRDPDAPSVPEGVLSTLLSRVPDRDARFIIGQVAVGAFDTDMPRLADLALARFGQIVGFDDASNFVAGVLAGSSSSDRGEDWAFTTRYVRWLRPFAEEGNPVAMRLMGVMLCETRDIKQGEEWLRRAAEGGDDDAVKEMAWLLRDTGRRTGLRAWIDDSVAKGRGRGIVAFAQRLLDEGERAEAKRWCRRAADLGNTDAMVAVGELCHEDGEWAEAKRVLTAAAEAGHPIGMYDLALILGSVNRRAADDWLRRSAEARYEKAVLNYALLLHQQHDQAGLEQWLEREQAAGDSEQVLAFATQLAARGHMQDAERWFGHAMHMGNIEAIRGLGDVKRSQGEMRQAAEYYQQAIDRGDIIAMRQLSTVYLAQEPDKAEQLLRRMLDEIFDFRDRSESEEEALGLAAGDLGLLLHNRGDTKEAEHWYEIAANFGNTEATHYLSRLKENPES
jgi:TPR repeat protein